MDEPLAGSLRDGPLPDVEQTERDAGRHRGAAESFGVSGHGGRIVPRRWHHRNHELEQPTLAVERACGGPVVGRVWVLGETPEPVRPPGRDLFLREVVAIAHRVNECGLDLKQEHQVLTPLKQLTEGIDHIRANAIETCVQLPLKVFYRQRPGGADQTLEQEWARAAPVAELEGPLITDTEGPPPRPRARRLLLLTHDHSRRRGSEHLGTKPLDKCRGTSHTASSHDRPFEGHPKSDHALPVLCGPRRSLTGMSQDVDPSRYAGCPALHPDLFPS